MEVMHLNHYNLFGSRELMDEVKRFYIDLLGFTEGARPDFPSDGSWLYAGGSPLLHLSVVEKSAEQDETGNLHHIALSCEGFDRFKTLFDEQGIDYTVGHVPGMKMKQLFIHDPSGLCIELNFAGE
jgi:catechol 2,3-dioxygenase-like lactoylglutathione lyase family enzyme